MHSHIIHKIKLKKFSAHNTSPYCSHLLPQPSASGDYCSPIPPVCLSEIHVKGVRQYVAFQTWLLSLSIMHLKVIPRLHAYFILSHCSLLHCTDDGPVVYSFRSLRTFVKCISQGSPEKQIQ